MKAMKLVMMAVVAVFMGTSLTSCLDSDGDNRDYGGKWVTIDDLDFTFTNSVKSDDGLTLKVLNPSNMKLGTGVDAYYPTRAYIEYYLPEGTIYEEGKTTYDIEFNGYRYATNIERDMTLTPEEGKTDVEVLILGGGKNYLDLYFGTLATKESSDNNYKVVVNKAEDKTLHLELVNTEEVKQGDAGVTATGFMISYKNPYRQDVTRIYPDLEFMGPNNDSIYIKFENKVNGSEMQKFKIKLR